MKYYHMSDLNTMSILMERIKRYQHYQVIADSLPLTSSIYADEIIADGLPFPYLLCKQPKNSGYIRINLIDRIAYKRFSDQQMIVQIESTADSFYSCELRCSN